MHTAIAHGTPKLPLQDTGTAPRPDRADTSGERRASGLLRLRRIPLVLALLFAGAVVGAGLQPPGLMAAFDLAGLEPGSAPGRATGIPAAPPATPAERGVAALGRLMPQGDTVTLALPFGAGDARIAALLVDEGDRVQAGDAIARLDSLPQLDAALAAARANLAEREAALAQTRATVASARVEATANRDHAASAAALAAEEADRQRNLFSRGATSRAALDRAEATEIQAARDLDRAAAQLARQEGGDRQPDVALALRRVDVARADLARAGADMARGTVVAPIDGTVIALHVRTGERPGENGIATLGETRHMQAELEIYQTDIARVAPGQSVTLSSAALSEPLTGTIARVGLEVERQTILSADPAANTDARIVRVTVALDPASSARAEGLTGLEVTGHISPEAP